MKLSPLAMLHAALFLTPLALMAEKPTVPASWKAATSTRTSAVRGDNWWQVFDDPQLTQLIDEATRTYPGLQAVLARVDQAKASVRAARSEWFPRLDARGDLGRSRYSDTAFAFGIGTMSNYGASAELSYELDLWGRIRGQVNAARADEASAAAAASAQSLVLAGEVARVYFTLRSIDEERVVLEDTVKLRQEALRLANARVEAGATNELDRVRAETELAATEAEAAALAGPRADLENTLALLLGRVATGYQVPARKLPGKLPGIPKVLPAELVQRRPDIASVMRQVEAAQARVGVARAAYFPKLSLAAGFGTQTSESSEFFDHDSQIWSVGLNFTIPIFDGGQRKAGVEAARAVLKEINNTYEEKLLIAFKEVESLMATIAAQHSQAEAQIRQQTAAEAAAKLARQRYAEGVATYLEVIEADRTALYSHRTLVQLRGQQLVSTVQLIKALGGGWASSN